MDTIVPWVQAQTLNKKNRYHLTKISPNENLEIVVGFIKSQLEGCETWTEDDEGTIVQHKKSPELVLASGSTVSCTSAKRDQDTTNSWAMCTVTSSDGDTSLSVSDNGTYSLYVESDHGEIELEGLTQEEAMANPEMVQRINSLAHTILVELLKPKKVYENHRLSQRLNMFDASGPLDQATSESILATERSVGWAELTKKGDDAALIDVSNQLYGVFDGIGSRENSAIAARITAVAIQEDMAAITTSDPEEVRQALVAALNDAHFAITAWQENAGQEISPGTTATVAQIIENPEGTFLAWASVGDSRLYIKNPEGQLIQITADEGTGRVLSNSLGVGFRGVKQNGILQLTPGTDIILVTDGVTGDTDDQALSSEEFLGALSPEAFPSPSDAARALIQIARKPDDRTAIVVRHS